MVKRSGLPTKRLNYRCCLEQRSWLDHALRSYKALAFAAQLLNKLPKKSQITTNYVSLPPSPNRVAVIAGNREEVLQ